MRHCWRRMSRAGLSWALALGVALPPASGRAGEPPATVSGRTLYTERRFVEASRVFEAEGTDAGLYNAGMARSAAGHDALAIDRWTRYLRQAEVSADERAEIEARIAEARSRVVTVRFEAESEDEARKLLLQRGGRAEDSLEVEWPAGVTSVEAGLDAVEWAAVLQGEDESRSTRFVVRAGEGKKSVRFAVARPLPVVLRLGPPQALRRGVEVTWSGKGEAPEHRRVRAEATQYALPRGVWRVEARARGFLPAEEAVTLRGGSTELDVQLRRDRPRAARVGLGVGLGMASAGLIVGGAVLTEAGSKTLGNETPGECPGMCPALLKAQVQRREGMALLGAGFGSMIPAVTAAMDSPRARRALAVETGIGAGLLAAGLAWYLCEGLLWKYRTVEDERDALARELGAGTLLGLGAGMFLAAGISLLTHWAVQRKTKTAKRSRGASVLARDARMERSP